MDDDEEDDKPEEEIEDGGKKAVQEDPNKTPASTIREVRSIQKRLVKQVHTMAQQTDNQARRKLFEEYEQELEEAANMEELNQTVQALVKETQGTLEALETRALRKMFQKKRTRGRAKLERQKAVVKQHNSSPSSSPSSSPPVAKRVAATGEQAMVREWEHDLADIVRRGVAPLIRFVGAVAVKLRENDIRKLLMWNPDNESVDARVRALVSDGARTVEEFMSLNRDLGRSLLFRYLKAAEMSLVARNPVLMPNGINSCFNLDDLDLPAEQLRQRMQWPSMARMRHDLETFQALPQPHAVDVKQRIANLERDIELLNRVNRAALGLKTAEAESLFAPAWCLQVLGDAVFRKLINDTTLAAFDMALAKLRRIENCRTFTFKELICSEQVHDQFAFMVASEWLNAGDDTALIGSKRRGPRSHYMNMMVFRAHLGRQLDTCAIWFESVRARPNPLLRRFEEKRQTIMAALPPGAPATVEHGETLEMYGRMLPARELYYFNN